MIRRRRITAGVTAAALLLAAGGGAAWAIAAAAGQDAPAPTTTSTPAPATPTPSETPSPSATAEPEPEPEPEHDIDSPGSYTVVVNKQRPFDPIDWAPDDLVMPEGMANNNGQPLREVAAQALQEMNEAATADGLPLTIASGYRSYSGQESLYNRYADADGVAAADRYSARPGYSEHQTGLAVDLSDGGGCTLEECFKDTETGKWLKKNSYKFGFILRFNEGQESVSGYIFEPWHFRYVGVELATQMHDEGIVNLEDFFDLPPAPNYD